MSRVCPAFGKSEQSKGVDLEKMVEDEKRGIFRVLDIGKPKPFQARFERRGLRFPVKAPPRETQMSPTQDWPSVWPAQRTFHPAVVPLPVRQGFTRWKNKPIPSKHANAELMKIPNFLHLTPPAIRRQCQNIKEFCTKWPQALNDDDALEAHFPLTEVTCDYLNASSSIRDNRARITSVKVSLSSLYLDTVSRDKFIRLVGMERYDPETDTVTITADRCPYRKQNREYCEYLLKALYYESRKREEWEVKSECDMEVFEWTQNQLSAASEQQSKEETLKLHKSALENVMNEGENMHSLTDYKAATKAILGLKDTVPVDAESLS